MADVKSTTAMGKRLGAAQENCDNIMTFARQELYVIHYSLNRDYGNRNALSSLPIFPSQMWSHHAHADYMAKSVST
eukprot:scaffold33694_cov150-Skeletonema_dohrnii-CCMP3373.AAC.1